MRGTQVLLRREFHRHWAVLVAAFLAGVFALALPLMPGMSSARTDGRQMVAVLVVGFGVAVGCAVTLGSSAVARDLGEGRFGFDLVRPLSARQIWLGRLGGALVLSLLASMLVLLPTALAVLFLPRSPMTDWGYGDFLSDLASRTPFGAMVSLDRDLHGWIVALPIVFFVILFLVPAAHAAGIAFRSRSRWIAVDLAGAAIAGLLTVVIVRRLWSVQAMSALGLTTVALILLAAGVLWSASAVQVAVGRGDLQRSHRVQVVALWLPLLLVVLGTEGITRWFATPRPTDLTHSRSVDRRDDWVELTGLARGRLGFRASFLLNVRTGEFVRVQPVEWERRNMTLSEDGTRAAWLRNEDWPDVELVVLDLERPEQGPRKTGIRLRERPYVFALSHDGVRAATLDIARGHVLVFDVDSGRGLADVPVLQAEEGEHWLSYRPDGLVRLYSIQEHSALLRHEDGGILTIADVDPETGEVTKTIRPPLRVSLLRNHIRWSSDHERLLVFDQITSSVLLLDGQTGELINDALSRAVVHSHAFFLQDGRIAAVESGAPGLRLCTYSRDGVKTRTIELGDHESVGIAGEPDRDHLFLGVGSRHRDPMTILLADLSVGEVREIASDLRPLGHGLFSRSGTIVRLTSSGEERLVPGR